MFQMLFPMVLLLFSCAHEALPVVEVAAAPQREVKLYWFIPDGMRAEPELFDIYAWAREGRLPNIAHMMENGAYGFAKPVYPGHTPVNFASLLTGAYPEVHGVADGPMHTEGHALTRPSVAGFRSTAKKVAPIWSTLEDAGRTVAIVSVPGSTPPELSTGYTLVGRWGGWGANFHAVNFQELGDGSVRYQQGRHARLFFFGPPLAAFPTAQSVDEAPPGFTSHAPVKRVELEAWGARVLAYLGDSVDDGETAYDSVYFTDEQGALLVELSSGQWSGWLDTVLTWDDIQVQTQFRIKLIKLQPDGWFRIRFLFNTMNETVTRPSFVASEVNQNVGPMVDFVDNFPPQLIYYPEDKDTFIEEARMSLDWHRDLSDWFLGHYRPDIFIHDIYTPNQMLTSRWWLGYIDPDCPRYAEKTDAEREQLWAEVHEMYERLDAILGVYLAHADEDTLVVLSSDHGAAPLHSWVHLNNLFARQGWLKYELQPETGELQIDWQASKVVYLKFGNVYIHPDGLHGEDGTWRRASGEAYLALRDEVHELLDNLRDENGVAPAARIANWEEAENVFRLPHERVGDLIISNLPGYGWNEEVTDDLALFSVPLKSGYKQSILTDEYPAMWTPFMVMGPGVKKGVYLGDTPISLVDEYPTLMHLLGVPAPDHVQGRVVEEMLAP